MPPRPDPEKKPETAAPSGPPPPAPPRPQNRPPMRRALPPKAPPALKRRHHRGKAGRARVGLGVMFGLFRIVDFLWINSMPVELNRLGYPLLILTALWTTPLLVAVARKLSWARLLFLALLGLLTIACLVGISPVLEFPGLITILIITIGAYAGSFFWLLYSRDVHRLIGRGHE